MPRVCTICQHKERKRIDAALAAGESSRPIASQFGVGYKAVQRHQECIAEALAKSREEREAQITVTVEAVMNRAFDAVLKILDACDEELRDPENPDRYTLSPRASNVRVVYEERTVEGGKERVVSKAATLQELLDLMFAKGGKGKVQTATVTTPTNFPMLLLKATDELQKLTELLARLEGRFRPVEKEIGQGNVIQLSVIQNILIQNGLLPDAGGRTLATQKTAGGYIPEAQQRR